MLSLYSDIHKVTQKAPNASKPRTRQIDTRDEIRRHDPEFIEEDGSSSHQYAKGETLFGQDKTEVSIDSLETFLPMLLKNYANEPQKAQPSTPLLDERPTSPAAKAAGAYARTMRKASVMNEPEEISPPNEGEEEISEQKSNTNLSGSELQIIYKLQKDIPALRKKGIRTIFIEKAGTFLESLQNAVEEALQA